MNRGHFLKDPLPASQKGEGIGQLLEDFNRTSQRGEI